MKDEVPKITEHTDEDLNETPPQGIDSQTNQRAGGWKMPEPVFQKTSGYLPQGFEKKFETDPAPTDAQPSAPSVEVPSVNDAADSSPAAAQAGSEQVREPAMPNAAADVQLQAPDPIQVEPQPDLIGELEIEPDDEPMPAPVVRKRSVAGRIIGILLAIVVIVILVVLFGLIVWFLLTPTPEATFN